MDAYLRARIDCGPHVKAGDALFVRGQESAEPGQVVTVRGADGELLLREFEPGMDVLGLVTWRYRRVT